MTVVLTAGLILFLVMACGALISATMVLAEALTRRGDTARLISGAEALLRSCS
jgi:hypothetical protein